MSVFKKIQYKLLSLFETFCFFDVPTYLFTSTQLQQTLNSIRSSQPDMNEKVATKFPLCSSNEFHISISYST
jgi:hypothetical protein